MAVTMAGHRVPAVDAVGKVLQGMLDKAELVKQTNLPLNKSDIGDSFEKIGAIFNHLVSPEAKKRSQYAVIDTAARDIFNNLLATKTIDDPSFIRLWNLLDIISILSDDDQCDPALLFWLVEELLDSQTIAGCRKIFDYLESRREKITAKNFSQKNLIILRSCNELLRRLSRAEDTAFCGRVFIFMFQSFPLGDKSSVNLRGEYHVENVTTFDNIPTKPAEEKMDIDSEKPAQVTSHPKPSTSEPAAAKKGLEENATAAKGVTFTKPETPLSPDELYPIFWSLQQSFNQPKKLFDPTHFAAFKTGIEATMVMFRKVQVPTSRSPHPKPTDKEKGTKRKRDQVEDDVATPFNPKYLTSRDLFELEISDLSFRRYICVQILIIMDFLLSLSAKAKAKINNSMPENLNKSVVYADQTLSEEDTTWVSNMKTSVSEYLRKGLEGAFFHRMVETVLARDKNWVRWKIENCPSIAKPAVTAEDYLAAKASVQKATANKRLRLNPLGSLDLGFLTNTDSEKGLERLKDPARYQVPPAKSLQNRIELDDMDIEMARDEESRNLALEAKASKSWRALRLASTTRLLAFDKVDSSENIEPIFKDKNTEATANGEEETLEDENLVFPKDRHPIVISGPSGVGKGTLIKMLLDKHGKVIGKKVSHTTRPPREGEIHTQHYFFVSKEEYVAIQDEGDFLEYNNYNGNDYGTSRKALDAITATGKIPLMEMDYHGIQQLKEKEYEARFIFLAPPHISDLQRRLEGRGTDSGDKIMARMEIAKDEIEHSKIEGFHDKIIVNDDLRQAYNELERYIFGIEEDEEFPTLHESAIKSDFSTPDVEMVVEVEASSKDDIPIQAKAAEVSMEVDESSNTEDQEISKEIMVDVVIEGPLAETDTSK